MITLNYTYELYKSKKDENGEIIIDHYNNPDSYEFFKKDKCFFLTAFKRNEQKEGMVINETISFMTVEDVKDFNIEYDRVKIREQFFRMIDIQEIENVIMKNHFIVKLERDKINIL